MKTHRALRALTRVLLLVTPLGITACGAANIAVSNFAGQVATAVPQAQADLNKAVNLWQITKGIALVAIQADPSLAAKLTPMIAQADGAVTEAQTVVNGVAPDLTAVAGLVQQITATANAATAVAAPVIQVVPTSPPSPAAAGIGQQ